MDLICGYCKISYRVKPCLVTTSKFCSRACHDKGKTYKKTGTKKAAAVNLRVAERLSVGAIAERLGIPYRRAARYLKEFPLSQEERKAAQIKQLSDTYSTRALKTNEAVMRRFDITRCEEIGCEWLLTVELHHINGDKTDNRRENVKGLCPNHHSITPNFRNRRRVPVD